MNNKPLIWIINVFVLLDGYFCEAEFYFPEAFIIDLLDYVFPGTYDAVVRFLIMFLL